MRHVAAAALVIAALAGSALGANNAVAKGNKPKGRICITFDELPVAKSFSPVDREFVTEQLLGSLQKHEAEAAGFVVGGSIEVGYDLLGRWLNGGHVLGNLGYSHQDLAEMSPDNFIRDVQAGDEALSTMLSGFGQKERYFRYPFLHYGNTMEVKREVGAYLASRNVQVVHATVIVEDYLYNLSLEKLGEEPDSADVNNLMSDYTAHVIAELQRCELLAQEILKRRCCHIILLRANMLNALSLDKLLTAVEDHGYSFVPLAEALDDKLYHAPEAYFGARGVGYLDMLMLSDPDMLPAE